MNIFGFHSFLYMVGFQSNFVHTLENQFHMILIQLLWN